MKSTNKRKNRNPSDVQAVHVNPIQITLSERTTDAAKIAAVDRVAQGLVACAEVLKDLNGPLANVSVTGCKFESSGTGACIAIGERCKV